MTARRGAGAWPIRHALQLMLAMLVLQPLLLLITLVDFARVWPDAVDALPMKALVKVSQVLRPGIGREAPATASALLRESALALQGVFITQAWYSARLASWHAVAEGYEQGLAKAEARSKAHSVSQQLERIVLTSCAAPLLWCASLLVIVLCGAPVEAHFGGTAVLAAYLALLVLFPVVHILGAPPSAMWTRVLAAPSLAAPREVLVLLPAAVSLVGALGGGAALALDWGRAWQTWPLPCVYGAAGGLLVGNVLAMGACAYQINAQVRAKALEASEPPQAPAAPPAAAKARRRRKH